MILISCFYYNLNYINEDQHGEVKKVIIYGVVRSDERGMSKCIIQKEMTCKEDKVCAQDNLKVAHLKWDSSIDGLLMLTFSY